MEIIPLNRIDDPSMNEPVGIILKEKTEEDAYYEAIKGQLSIEDIGILSFEELSDIARWPPNISFYEYMRIRELTLKEMLERVPLNLFIPLITRGEAFFYLTRGWLDEQYDLPKKLQRLAIYENSQIKELLDLLYGSKINFVTALPNPLEDELLAFDDIFGDRERLRLFAENRRISLFEDEITVDIYNYFVLKIITQFPSKHALEEEVV